MIHSVRELVHYWVKDKAIVEFIQIDSPQRDLSINRVPTCFVGASSSLLLCKITTTASGTISGVI